MKLQLITPEKILFEGTVTLAQIPGSEGEFGVLPGHAPFISTLKNGLVTLAVEGGATRKMIVAGGVAEVNPERTIILAEKAEDVSALTDAEIISKLQ